MGGNDSPGATTLKGADVSMNEREHVLDNAPILGNYWQKLTTDINQLIEKEYNKAFSTAVDNLNNGINSPSSINFSEALDKVNSTLTPLTRLKRDDVEFVVAANVHLNKSYIADEDIRIWANHIVTPQTAQELEQILNDNGFSLNLDHHPETINQTISSLMQAHPLTLEDRHNARNISPEESCTKEEVLAEMIQDFYAEALATPELQDIADENNEPIISDNITEYQPKNNHRHYTYIELFGSPHRENTDIHGIPVGHYTFEGYQEQQMIADLIKNDPAFVELLKQSITSINSSLSSDHSLNKDAQELIRYFDEYQVSMVHEANVERQKQDVPEQANESLELQEKLDKLDEMLNELGQEENNSDDIAHNAYDELDIMPERQAALEVLNGITPDSIEQENRAFCAEMGVTLEEYHEIMDEGSEYFRTVNHQDLESYFDEWEDVSYTRPISEEEKQDVRDFYDLAEEYRIDTTIIDGQIENTLHLKEVIATQSNIIDELDEQIDKIRANKDSELNALAENYLSKCTKSLRGEAKQVKTCIKQLRDSLVEACSFSKYEFANANEGLQNTQDNFRSNLKLHKNILQDYINEITCDAFCQAAPYKAIIKCNNTMINVCNKASDKIGAVSKASQQATKGIRNIGRAIIGRPPLETNQEIGNIAQSLTKPFQMINDGCQRERDACMNQLKIFEKLEEQALKSRETQAQRNLVSPIDKVKDTQQNQQKLNDVKARTTQNKEQRNNERTTRAAKQNKQKRKRDDDAR